MKVLTFSPFFTAFVCLGVSASPAWSEAIRNVAGPVILDAYTGANPSAGTDTLSITLGSGNYNLPHAGNGNNAGRGVIIGENNILSTPGSHVAGYAIIAGYSNNIRVHGGIVAGYNNRMSYDQSSTTNFGKFTSIFGISNTVNPGAGGSYASMVVGSNQRLTGDYTFLSGQENLVGGPSLSADTLNSVAMGTTNTIASEMAWTIGSGNFLTGVGASAFGTGLSATHKGEIALGSYNAEPVVDGANGLDLRTNYFSHSPALVVGNGTSDGARSNALVLRRSGNLEIAGEVYTASGQLMSSSQIFTLTDAVITSRLHSSGGVALSFGVLGGGQGATAMSRGVASGSESVAMSFGEANGAYSVAMSGGIADGNSSVAIGYGTATGDYSIASGAGTVASSHGSAAFGFYNVIDLEQSAPLQALFTVGNGTGEEGRSNALEILKNGKTKLTNRNWSSTTPTEVPPNATEASDGNALEVDGHTVLNGNTRLKGRVTMDRTQGDVGMGIYE